MNTNLKKLVSPTLKQVEAIRALDAACYQADGYHAKIYWNIIEQRRTEDITDFLMYDQDVLIGYLGLYTFREMEVEVSGMVHPDYRKQGIFTKLWETAQHYLKASIIKEYIFVYSQGAEPATTMVKKMGVRFDFSEYVMRITTPPKTKNIMTGLEFRPATKHDILKLVQFDMACFNNKFEDGLSRFTSTINSSNRKAWLIYDSDKLVGKIHVRYDRTCSYIHDFAVLPQYQGQGYGKAILHTKVQELYDTGHTTTQLDVTVTNENALNLYKKCGFKIITAYDFWRLSASNHPFSTSNSMQ